MQKNNLTPQIKVWTSKFGENYTDRWNLPIKQINRKSKEIFGITTSDLFKEIIENLKLKTILEVGCNAGRKLEVVSQFGNYQLFGIDPQIYALKKARKKFTSMNFIEGTVFNMPFRNSFFDLVFTYEVLIHISPKDLLNALKEIVRVSNKYILHMEYYTTDIEEVNYRGLNDIVWKRDFVKFYLKHFPNLKVIKSKILEWDESIYGKKNLYSKIFLLSKNT